MGFERTTLWCSSLAPQLAANPGEEQAREALRAELIRSRSYASTLASEINRDIPDYTVHDITHIDALWEMAEVIAGPAYRLTPTEAYVFGSAVLTHDLAMGIAAYPGGSEELQADRRWRDGIVLELRSELGRLPSEAEAANPSAELASKVRVNLLRERHAEQAARIPTAAFGNPDASIYFIADPELRGLYGDLIGRLAASHWWDASRLTSEFEVVLGSPGSMPQEWTVDPLRLACLLRCADAAHLDVRRAPILLRAIRNLSGVSADHWNFQQKLQRPRLEGDRLAYTAAQPFGPAEADSWWLALEAVRVVDHELLAADAILADARRQRFEARSVAQVDDPERFSRYVPVRDWFPIDARLHIGDVTDLVRKLGGQELYGADPHVPLRELISNASDAVNAKAAMLKAQGQAGEQGQITVSLEERIDGIWLKVSDTGLGMNKDVMADALLNFGSSYWDSAKARSDLPGLWSAGFRPTGKYGIGFFSVFMLGNEVQVSSRRFDAAASDTYILEFGNGLQARPLLRAAREAERSLTGGTVVSVRLRNAPSVPGGLLAHGNAPNRLWRLRDLCAWMAPALDVDLYVIEDGQATLAVAAGDWRNLPPRELILRLTAHLRPRAQSLALACSERIRDVSDANGATVARLALVANPRPNHDATGGAPIMVGGLRTETTLNGCIGLAVGLSLRAARDVAVPAFFSRELSGWASEQAKLSAGQESPETEAEIAERVLAFRGDAACLYIAESSAGWVRLGEISKFAESHDEILLLQDAALWNLRRTADPDQLEVNPNVVAVGMGRVPLLGGHDHPFFSIAHDDWGWRASSYFHDAFTSAGAVAVAVGSSWGFEPEDTINTLGKLSNARAEWEDRVESVLENDDIGEDEDPPFVRGVAIVGEGRRPLKLTVDALSKTLIEQSR